MDDVADQSRAELADLIDLQMSSPGLAAIDALRPQLGDAVLDVGCGTGQSLVQLAGRVGPDGSVVGVDIAPRCLELARVRTAHLPNVKLLQADAASLALPDQNFDRIFSRFGVMFFSDPTIAFSNLRRMLKPQGRIGFVCWRSLDENELDLLPLEAADLPIAVDTRHFSLEKAEVIEAVLRSAGFDGTRVQAYDLDVSCGDVAATLKVVTRVGALGKILRDRPALLAKAEPRVRAALEARERHSRVSLRAAAWIVTAHVG